jgi:RecA-family ATPase
VSDAIEILDHIDPAMLTYEEWLQVGMALQHAGATAADWDQWSRRDHARYKTGECWRKWDGFRGSAKPVTAGTLVALAKAQGWRPPKERQTVPDRELEWDDEIGGGHGGDGLAVVRQEWVQDEEIQEPGDGWNPVRDLSTYLSTLFQSDEHVGYVTESWEDKDGRHLPKKGCWDRTAGQLLEALQGCGGDIGAVIGDCNPEVGAWIRFNPVDGKGVRDENVTSYRYALIESDEIPVAKQMALVKELELPVAALVHSGGKSLHAIVRVDADDYAEYRKRVDFLYEVCQRNGIQLDRQNRNPSRLSRMPGIMRNGRKQFLAGTNMGKGSWKEWQEWIEDLKDNLPDIAELEFGQEEPPLAPEIISGVLREGHKMLLSGPSKAGKSYALLQLCIAMAEGGDWFGWRVRQGRVLYVNLELDKMSCIHRYWSIYREMGKQKTPDMLDVWQLRGNATTLDKLAPKLIRRAQKKHYQAVVIDPIYKVLTGDENSAEEMARFCNQFDKICLALGAATIYCHHHSKGAQGQKASRDRSSGSGVFARDPDAILDMIELQIDGDRRKQIHNRWECAAMERAYDVCRPDWRDKCPQDDALVAESLARWGEREGMGDAMRASRTQAWEAADKATGWRIEGTVREFAPFSPRRIFFRWPLHVEDSWGLLADAKADGEEPPWMAAAKEKQRSVAERRKEKAGAIEAAFAACSIDGNPAVAELAEYLGCTEKTVRNQVRASKGLEVKDGKVSRLSTETDR